MKITTSRFVFVSGSLLYYLSIIYGTMAYANLYGHFFQSYNFDFSYVIIGLITVFCLALNINIQKVDLITIVQVILLCLWLIPLVCYTLLCQTQLLLTLSACISFYCFRFANIISNSIHITPLKNGHNFANVLIGLLPVLTMIVLLGVNGLPTLNAFNFSNVYEIRANFKSNTLIEYLQSYTVYVIIPFTMGFSIKTKNNKLLLLSIVFNVLIFTICGGKYIFFVTLFAYFTITIIQKKLTRYIPFVFALLMFLLFGMYEVTNEIEFIHLGLIRPFCVPPYLSMIYSEFFSVNGYLWFSEVFPSVFDSKYGYGSAILIGDLLFINKGGSWANGNWVGDAYANAGPFGVILYGAIFTCLLGFAKKIDNLGDNLGFKCSFIVTVSHMSFVALTRCLASRGMLFALFIGFLYITYNKKKHLK